MYSLYRVQRYMKFGDGRNKKQLFSVFLCKLHGRIRTASFSEVRWTDLFQGTLASVSAHAPPTVSSRKPPECPRCRRPTCAAVESSIKSRGVSFKLSWSFHQAASLSFVNVPVHRASMESATDAELGGGVTKKFSFN